MKLRIEEPITIEQWRKVKGWPPYKVSSFGRVSGYRGILRENLKGYCFVHLYSGGKSKQWAVHRLVARAFIKNPKQKGDVNHIDGNKKNNIVSNLEWATRKENVQHSLKLGKHPVLERHGRAKLKREDVLFIRASDLNYCELGRIYNVHYTTIKAAKLGKTWKDI